MTQTTLTRADAIEYLLDEFTDTAEYEEAMEEHHNAILDEYLDSDDFEEEMAEARAEILAAYEREGSPLAALTRAAGATPVLHLYAQPPQPEYLQAQRAFADAHPWFSVERVDGKSHFLMLEMPEDLAERIERFVRTVTSPRASI